MGAFDGARTHDWQVSTDQESDALPTAPCRLMNCVFDWFKNKQNILDGLRLEYIISQHLDIMTWIHVFRDKMFLC